MSKFILTVDQTQTASAVKRFVARAETIVGLLEDVHGRTIVVIKVPEVAQPKATVVEESFDEIAEIVLGNQDKTVLTIDHRYQQSNVKRFVVDVNKIKGVLEDGAGTLVTVSVHPNTPPAYTRVLESFDEIANLVVYGPFDEEQD